MPVSASPALTSRCRSHGWRWSQLKAHVGGVFAIDLYSLACFRIAIGGILSLDAWRRLADATMLYSDAGAFARNLAASPPLLRGLYFVDGSPAWATFLLLLQGFFGVSFLCGFYTKLSQACLWILYGSLASRFPWGLQAGDVFLRQILFWTFFLPSPARWSLDNALPDANRSTMPAAIRSGISFAALGQLYLLYLVAGAVKIGHAHWQRGDAVFNALGAEYLVSANGIWLRSQALELGRILTWSTLLLEVGGPVALLLCPPRWWRIRMAVIASFMLFHLGLAVTLNLGIFSWIMMAAWLLAVPSDFWQRLKVGRVSARGSADANAHRPSMCTRLAAMAVGGLFINLIIVSGLSLGGAPRPIVEAVAILPKFFELNRHWSMFAGLRSKGGSVAVIGVNQNGRDVELAYDGQRQMHQALPSERFNNQRWRKALVGLAKGKSKRVQRSYLRFVCQQWNAIHDKSQHMQRVGLYYLSRRLGAHGPKGALQRRERLTIECH